MIHTAEEILSKIKAESIWGDMGDDYAEDDVIKAINEARIAVLDEIKSKVVDNRNIAHVACLESEKQTFNLCINIIENAIHQIK